MGELLHRAAAEDRLAAAWAEVRENDLADGEKSRQVAAFERGVLRRLAELGGQLRAGAYEPSPVTALEVPKPSGGTRLLAVPQVADRVVERAVLEVVEPYVDPVLLPWSYAYRRGLGVRDAVHALAEARDAGCAWAVRADIRDCFEDIPRRPVLTRLRELVPDDELCAVVRRLVERPAVGPAADRVRTGKGLHQGSALSPVLTNLYLDSFDRALLAAGHTALRYADDIAVPVASRSTGEEVLAHAAEALHGLGLRLNEAKSRITSFDEGVEFLGRTLGPRDGLRGEELAHPLEGTVHVTEPGALLRTRGDRLRVVKGEQVLLNLSLRRVRQVVCTGRIGMSTPFLHRALEHGVDVVLLDDLGRYRGRLAGTAGSHVERRAAQHRTTDEPDRALRLARAFVTGKITNMRTGLLRAARRTSPIDAAPAAARMLAARADAARAATRAELMGCEGAASRDYFACLGVILGEAWGFTHRQRRPPPDPVQRTAVLRLHRPDQ
ncbi:CRISPR-associated endonuclease Cas1 [Streptomyces sp. NPDC001380]|uniref:CRISPR-associated endonuclease Cas1 n=1 Tax=Streptomyces sp. NPDC001380 TaxID=3364566 RepID=UPI0036C6ADAE